MLSVLQLKNIQSKIITFLKKYQTDNQPINRFGCYIHKDAISIAVPMFDQASHLTSIELHTKSDEINSAFAVKLRVLCEAWQIRNMTACWILSKEHYQTLLIDKPDVKPSEFRAAALWQAKDLLKYPMEDCVVDIFLPSKRVAMHEKKLYLVAAKKSWITNIVETFDKVEVPIVSIITEEFALRNVIYQLIGNAITGVLVKQDNHAYLFMVIGEGDILFTRTITESLVTELYRSIEFYSITLKQDKLDSLFMINIDEYTQVEISQFFSSYDYAISLKTVDALYQRYQVNQPQVNLPGLFAIGGVFDQQNQQ